MDEIKWKAREQQTNKQEPSLRVCECGGTGYIKGNIGFRPCPKCMVAPGVNITSIPERLKDKTLKDFDVSLYKTNEIAEGIKKTHYECAVFALAQAKRYVEAFSRYFKEGVGLYIYGTTAGTGKTLMAVSVLKEITARYGVTGLFIPTINLIREITETYSKDYQYTFSEVIDSIKNVQVLVLDDIGVEQQKPYIEEILKMVLDERNRPGRVTIFTSNTAMTKLKHEHYIISRICEMTEGVYLPGHDIRQTIAAMRNKKAFSELKGEDKHE